MTDQECYLSIEHVFSGDFEYLSGRLPSVEAAQARATYYTPQDGYDIVIREWFTNKRIEAVS